MYRSPDHPILPMSSDLTHPRWPDLIEKIRARTPARVLVERAGAAYRTGTQLQLRQAHAAARDAVRTEFNLEKDLGAAFVRQWGLFEVSTCANSKDEYLLRPDLGRRLNDNGRQRLAALPKQTDLQIVIGDGLSVTAVATQVPQLLPIICEQARNRGWTLGQPFVIGHCRVGAMNDVGELLNPKVIVLLIGERPGLATAESLSAYMAFRPRPGDNDADRNLISNIHARGVSCEAAATRIVKLAEQMMRRELSGVKLKESLPPEEELLSSSD
jgi:ethanolamine ammonia-lyase small subunit